MEVEADENNEFQSAGEDGESNESNVVTFRKQGHNNNASPMQMEDSGSESEGEIVSDTDKNSRSSDEEDEELMNVSMEWEIQGKKDKVKSDFVQAMMIDKERTKEEFVDAAMEKFQEVFMKSGILETATKLQKHLDRVEASKEKLPRPTAEQKRKGKKQPNNCGKEIDKILGQASTLELTVYKNAVKNEIEKKRNSGSSSDQEQREPMEIDVRQVNSSDELDDSDEMGKMLNESMVEEFIAEARNRQFPVAPRPGTSGIQEERRPSTPDEKAAALIRNAENSRARIHDTPGNEFMYFEPSKTPDFQIDLSRDFVHSAMVDESYQLVASHLDKALQAKIIRGKYINFGKLVPKDHVLTVDDSRYEMIVRDGKTYWVPANNNESTEISNFNCLEQAFRVYSDVYVWSFPQRASELVQYGHLIHTAAQSYVWENVYMYDKDFRLHLA